MSDNTTPIEPFFELQRETITQTVSMLTGPQQVRQSMTEDGTAAGKYAQEQTLALSRQAVHQALGAAETLGPDGETSDELHDRVDEAFDQFAEHQSTTIEQLTSLQQTANEQFDARIVAGLALLLRANESLERQTSVSAEQIEAAVLQDEEATADLECAIEEFAEALESSAGQFDPSSVTDIVHIPVSDDAEAEAESTASEAKAESATGTEKSTAEAEEVADDEVRCRICDETFGAITYSHLQTHDMSVAEYTEEFADAPLRPEDRD